jgi:hypothetical protein
MAAWIMLEIYHLDEELLNESGNGEAEQQGTPAPTSTDALLAQTTAVTKKFEGLWGERRQSDAASSIDQPQPGAAEVAPRYRRVR